jgi:hypothetical protein
VSPNQSRPTPLLPGWLRIGVWNWLKSKKDAVYIGIVKGFSYPFTDVKGMGYNSLIIR